MEGFSGILSTLIRSFKPQNRNTIIPGDFMSFSLSTGGFSSCLGINPLIYVKISTNYIRKPGDFISFSFSPGTLFGDFKGEGFSPVPDENWDLVTTVGLSGFSSFLSPETKKNIWKKFGGYLTCS